MQPLGDMLTTNLRHNSRGEQNPIALKSLTVALYPIMPVEPLSITAAVIAVTRLTYDSCKSLNDSIKGLRHAPDTLKGLERSLGAFETVTNPLQQDLAGLGDDPDAFSADQQASLRALQPVMHCCRTACDEFAGRLAELTSHSNEGHMSWRDRFRLQFNDSDIRILKENLAQCQQTLGDALGFANLYVVPFREHGNKVI